MISPFILLAGPCVLEDRGLSLEIAQELKRQTQGLPLHLTFKGSFDKANRTSVDGYRGPGLEAGLRILEDVQARTGLDTLTDIHTVNQVEVVSQRVGALQIPAFLCRQTDLILAAATACLNRKRRLNLKKGQFLAPSDARHLVGKVRAAEAKLGVQGDPGWCTLTERGVSFGYQTLIVDMAGIPTMKTMGVPVIYDATHSIQRPGAGADGQSTGGRREHLEVLARAAVAAGADGLFLECHPDPVCARSDGPNAFYLEHVGAFVRQLLEIRRCVAYQPYLLPEAQQFVTTQDGSP